MNPDRDRLLEDALTHELRTTGTPAGTDPCLDAETVAAWMDGGLDPASLAMAEAHASNCARCQALLGTLVRTTPAAPAAEARGAGLWRWWFAPLAATAAAVTVWMVVPPGQLSAPPTPTAIESAVPEASLAKGNAESAVAQSAPATAQPEAKDQAGIGRQKADAPTARAEAAGPKREAQAFEARERPAEAAKVADAVAVPPDARVTARSSPSPDVIWLVGREGIVFLATDGRTFLRVPFPEAIDLTAVTATDERNAVVTTADGRTFQTADGGRTWRRS